MRRACTTSMVWVLLVGWGLSVPPLACAETDHLIRYQGQAADEQGVPLEGPYDLTLRLYPAETGGATVWEETHPAIPLTGGYFTILLGQHTSLVPVDWHQSLWLSIQVGSEPELAPRHRITSVPLAIQAETAKGLTSAITPTLINPQGSGSSLDADTVDGQHASDLLNRTNHTSTQLPSSISPQGSGSSLDADTVDGKHASEFFNRANHTGTQTPSTISPQGSGSGLNADLVDGKDAAAFATNPHTHQCSDYRNVLPSGRTPAWLCEQNGQWCVTGLSAGGRDPIPCTDTNPGFGDWGAICCR